MAQFEIVTRTGAEQTRWLGSSDSQRAAVRQVLDRIDVAGFSVWADLPLAQAWFQRAVDLSWDSRLAEFQTMTYAQQQAAIREAWQALGYGYQALNLPPFTDPAYVELVTAEYSGPTWCRSETTGFWCGAGNAVERVAAHLWGWPATGDDFTCNEVRRRIELDGGGHVVDRNLAPPEGAREWNDADGWGAWRMFRMSGEVPFTIDNPMDWGSYSIKSEHNGWGAPNPDDVRNIIFPDLYTYFVMVRQIAWECLQRRPLGVIAQSLVYALGKNARTAHAAHIGPDATRLIGLADIEIEQARHLEGVAHLGELLSTLGAAIPGAQLYLGIPGAVLTALSEYGAVGLSCDTFGRPQPSFELSSISGDLTHGDTAGAPTQAVPDPPGFNREAHPVTPPPPPPTPYHPVLTLPVWIPPRGPSAVVVQPSESQERRGTAAGYAAALFALGVGAAFLSED